MEQLAGLESAEAAKLLEIIAMGNSGFAAVDTAFQQAFVPERYGPVVLMLRMLLDKPNGLSDDLESVSQSLIVYQLLRTVQLSAQNARKSPVAALVKATFFHELQRLETFLRDDARAAEAQKYKQSNAANAKKQSAKEVGELDAGRCHLLMKVFLFRLLLGRPSSDAISELIATSRATLETEADSWSAQPQSKQALVEAIAELKSAAEAENSLSLGFPHSRAVLVSNQESASKRDVPVATVRAAWARPKPTCLAVAENELRFLCAPSASTSLVVDATTYSADWSTATSLLATGRTQSLLTQQHQQLVAAASKCAGHFGLTVQAFIEVSEHNPHTAAQLLQSIPQQELYIDSLIALPNAAGCLRSEVILAASSALQAHQLSGYVKAMTNHIRSLPKAQQNDAVSPFAVTLHQLSKKRELSKADTDTVSPLFLEFAQNADVSSLWSSVVKA